MKNNFLTCVLLAVAFSFAHDSLCRLPAAERTTIVAFGDSTTAKRGELKVYCNLLQAELPDRETARITNAGVPGNTTRDGRKRFEKDVLGLDPDVVIIQFGINDAAVDVWKKPPATESRVSLKDFGANLNHFIKTLQRRDVRILLMTPNPLRWTPKMRELYGKPPYAPESDDGFNVKLKAYASAVRKIAEAKGVPLIDVYQQFEAYGKQQGKSVDDLLLDGIHPNEHGHRIVADALMDVLRKKRKNNADQKSLH